MRHNPIRWGAAALAVAFGVLVPAAASAGASESGVAKQVIKIGVIYPATGAFSSTFKTVINGVNARVAVQNKEHGGINGRKLVVVFGDDQSTVAGNQTVAQDLVQNKQVFGVEEVSSFVPGGYRYLQQQGIPVTGNGLGGPIWGQQPNTNMFSCAAPVDPTIPTVTQVGNFYKLIDAKRVGFLGYANSPSAVTNIATIDSIKAAGIQVPYVNQTIPIGSVNFTTVAIDLKSNNVDAIGFPAVLASDVGLMTAIRNAGLSIKQLYNTGYQQSLLDDPSSLQAAQGAYFSSQTLPYSSNAPAMKAYLKALNAYDSEFQAGFVPDSGRYFGWCSTDLMIKGLQVAGHNPTRASFIKNLTKVKSYDVGGLLATPFGFNHFGKLVGKQCAYYVQLKGSAFVPFPSNGQPVCGKVIPNSGHVPG
jgi:ABC-type branched-subunit amino acid transport system substrate-binding protein